MRLLGLGLVVQQEEVQEITKHIKGLIAERQGQKWLCFLYFTR